MIAVSKSPLMPIERPSSPWSRASLSSRAKNGAGSISSGGTHIRPATGSSAARACSSREGSSAIAQPAFCSSAPILTFTKQGRRRPALSIAFASAFPSEGRSSEWMQSNSRTASSALLDWSWPTRCSSTSGCASRSAGHLPCASCTRFSPKTRCPASISGAMAPASWVLLIAISVTSLRSRRASLQARAIRLSILARREAASSMARGYSVRMPTRQTLPELWLISDERNDSVLEDALARLPRGSGFIYRHYHLPDAERVSRYRQLESIARARDHIVILADSALTAREWGADGIYGAPLSLVPRRADMLLLATAHSMREKIGRAH